MTQSRLEVVYIVADYGDSLAFAEVDAALVAQFPGVRTVPVRVPQYRTEVAGFVAAQLARRALDPRRVAILINVDARTHTSEPLPDGAGSPFVCATLDSGLRVFSPASGFCLSFLRDRIARAEVLLTGAGSGQFRSRDDFPRFMAEVFRGNGHAHTPFPLDQIPEFQPAQPVVLEMDGYSNVKTSITRTQAEALGWKPGRVIQIRVGGRGADYPLSVTCATSIMGVPPGTFVFAPGSSGDPTNPYMEFAVRTTGPECTDTGVSVLGKHVGALYPGAELKIEFPRRERAPRQTVRPRV